MRRFELLAKLVNKHGWTKGAEIGVYKGATFFYLLDHCPELHLIGVDSWLPLPETQIKSLDKGLSDPAARTPAKMQKFAADVISRAQQHPRATIYYEDSAICADRIEDGSLDFIFIDADHSTESVVSDIQAWRPKVCEGGWILGHDAQWGSVQRALKQTFTAWTMHPHDNVWSWP